MKFKLQEKQMTDYEECFNYLGFKEIEILHFNYDGQGNVLILEDGNLSYMNLGDLRFIFFSGWYKGYINKDLVKPQLVTINGPNTIGNNLGTFNLDENSELTNLDNSPLLKRLLTNYILAEYEELAEVTDEYLWMEYLLLKRNNELDKLFIQESLSSTIDL